jgi:hypothetical protein
MSEPNLIRNDSPHQVSMPEGANFAIGKKATAQEPTVRKVLAISEDTDHADLTEDHRVRVPDADVPQPVVEQPTSGRQIKEEHALVPAAELVADTPAEAMSVQRAENDHRVLIPESLPEKSAVALVPEALAVTETEQAPLIMHTRNDRFVALPDPVPETMSRDVTPRSEPAQEAPLTALPETVTAASPELSDTLLTMLQMDFPARVVNLKIENDKVRTKLDVLQSSSRS